MEKIVVTWRQETLNGYSQAETVHQSASGFAIDADGRLRIDKDVAIYDRGCWIKAERRD